MFRSLLLVTIPFISIAAHAVTFDYRHETNDKAGNNHKDRLLMSHRFANGFACRWKGNGKVRRIKIKPMMKPLVTAPKWWRAMCIK